MKSAAIFCALLCLASAAPAQTSGATIVLPPQLLAGRPATLAVLGPDGRLLPGAALDFTGGKQVTTDATGRASFRAPNDPGVMTVRLSGTQTSATATVLAAPEEPPAAVKVTQAPRVTMLGEPFAIRGEGFRGEADANRVFIGGRPAAVLAASQVSLVLLPSGETPPGSAQLALEIGEHKTDSTRIRLVAIELITARSSLAAGEKGKVSVRIRGTEQPLELDVRNLTPAIVRLTLGDAQRVRTAGGAENAAAVEMEGLRAGDFSISARLVRPAAGLPDTETAREQLIAARAQASAEWVPRVERLITQLGENPQNALRVRNELEKMLSEMPPGEFGRLLESAWRALLIP